MRRFKTIAYLLVIAVSAVIVAARIASAYQSQPQPGPVPAIITSGPPGFPPPGATRPGVRPTVWVTATVTVPPSP